MKIVIYSILLLFLLSCSGNVRSDSKEEQPKIQIIRFDKDMFECIESSDKECFDQMRVKYPLLLPAVASIALGKSYDSDSLFVKDIQTFFLHPTLFQIYRDEQTYFADIRNIETILDKSSAIANNLFPNHKFPIFGMHVSGFKENIIVLEDMISLSADKYMGSDYPAYSNFFASYERQQMRPRMIARDYLKAWILSDLVDVDSTHTLLSSMIEQGKVLHLLSLFLPEFDEADVIGYTDQQLKWCQDHEDKIWKTVANGSNLFTSDFIQVSKYIADGAYTLNMGIDSPGRIGSWIGWQIVKKYIKKYPNVSITDLIEMDAQHMLKGVKYNP